MSPKEFDQWIKVNAELSLAREDAEKVIKEVTVSAVTQAMETCFESILPHAKDVPHTEYHLRKAINILADTITQETMSFTTLLEIHNGVRGEFAPSAIVVQGCREAISTHGKLVSKLFDEISN
ncbi:hypothetical protein PHABIO_370 [Pseudomonas phage Phabio]|uniref:Uncharacterized protein n=1 Tax=Pseudomonas phage Phabio TaxID=2006668 RepID=A0A1Y0SU18_9CAUD|nr:hypothetical protein MZD05_gp370 [Pseudomonas phage Phabio]ARV77001.1 hypothetical protein PHABIO_370 [Pseudomonas phage Phabio]